MNGYERANKDKQYYYVNSLGQVDVKTENNSSFDYEIFDTANYYSSEEVAKNNARADELMRQLRRYAARHNERELNWRSASQLKWEIDYDFELGKISVYNTPSYRAFGSIYFSSMKVAKQAVEEFEDELFWYFTKYRDHIADPDKMIEAACKYCGDNEKLAAMAVYEFKYCPKCGKKLEADACE